MKLKALDLFCCCGGISKGLTEAGFECTGVDITDNHNYPYEFIHKDVFDLDINYLKKFDLIHASPPCQLYSWSARQWMNKGQKFPDLIQKTRELLNKINIPYIIENVVGAPLRKDLVLCGEMFGLRVVRHRIFEISGFTVLQPPHKKHIKSTDGKHSYYACVSGHGGHGYSRAISVWQRAMGIDWVSKERHLTQMIPPAYSEYIAKFINFV